MVARLEASWVGRVHSGYRSDNSHEQLLYLLLTLATRLNTLFLVTFL